MKNRHFGAMSWSGSEKVGHDETFPMVPRVLDRAGDLISGVGRELHLNFLLGLVRDVAERGKAHGPAAHPGPAPRRCDSRPAPASLRMPNSLHALIPAFPALTFPGTS